MTSTSPTLRALASETNCGRKKVPIERFCPDCEDALSLAKKAMELQREADAQQVEAARSACGEADCPACEHLSETAAVIRAATSDPPRAATRDGQGETQADELKTLKARVFADVGEYATSHSTACFIWGDTGGQDPNERHGNCNCGALINYHRQRAEKAEATLTAHASLVQEMEKAILALPRYYRSKQLAPMVVSAVKGVAVVDLDAVLALLRRSAHAESTEKG